MNYLAHLYFSNLTPDSCVGQLLPDCMPLRGLPPEASAELLHYAQLHQHIDRFTDHHPVVIELRHSFLPPYRRFAGVLVDVFFDYVLARQWSDLHWLTLPEFADQVYAQLGAYKGPENDRLKALRQALLRRQWIPNYATREGIDGALRHLDQRSRFETPLAHSVALLETYDTQISASFERFFPDLKASVTAYNAL